MSKKYYSLLITFFLITTSNGMDSYLNLEDRFEDLADHPAFKNFKKDELLFDMDDKTARTLIELENKLWVTPPSVQKSQSLIVEINKIIRSEAAKPEPHIRHARTLCKAISIKASRQLSAQEKKRLKRERLKKKKEIMRLDDKERDMYEFEKTLTELKNKTAPRSPGLTNKIAIKRIVVSIQDKAFKPGKYKVDILIKALEESQKRKKSKKRSELIEDLKKYKEKTNAAHCIIKKSGSTLWIA